MKVVPLGHLESAGFDFDCQTLIVNFNLSLNLTNLYKKFNEGNAPQAEFFAQIGGRNGVAKDRDFNVDLVPKFIMAHGNLVRRRVVEPLACTHALIVRRGNMKRDWRRA